MPYTRRPPSHPVLTLVVLPPATTAQALFDGSCSIRLNSLNDYRDFPYLTCEVVVHEWGHLVLGPAYFAAVNPSDLSHSPDPGDIMNVAGKPHFRPCEQRIATGTHRRRLATAEPASGQARRPRRARSHKQTWMP